MALNKDIFLGAGTTLTHIPECDLYLGVGRQNDDSAFPTNGSLETTEVKASALFLTNFSLIDNLYVGCLIERYSQDDTLMSTHRVKSNTSTTITTTHSFKPHATDYFVIRAYGAPTPAPTSTAKRLLSDQWLGILESATFPTVEPEMKQLNLSLGGSRNYSYQYKGITAIGNGDLSLMANHGAWLYYFLGRCTSLICSTEAVGSSITDRFNAGESDKILIEGLDESGADVGVGSGKTLASFTETGPIFYRTVGNDICPPLSENDIAVITNMDVLTRPTINTSGQITNPITYTFDEANTDHLPSFAMERSDSKLAATTPFRTDSTSIPIVGGSTTSGDTTITFTDNADSALMQVGMLISGTGIPTHTRIAQIVSGVKAELTNTATATGSSLTFTLTEDEDNAFIQIARGCRVNTLTMTANENEEVKMQLSLNSRNVHLPKEGEVYDGRRGISNDADFFNYEGETTGANAAQEFREPFFFSDGRFTVLGQEFLKINTLTLTMNNNLQDKRFLGVGSKDIQESIPAQRTYEIAFTGHVTDNALYKALRDDAENITQTIELIFTKPNGEAITLNFTDYMVSANNFPISDDKSALVVEATVMPRNLSLCTVKTHWVLQG